ncbi:MAG: spore cortex biosynthesis protein YabQ [Lachnospiraceae bacterium]
MNDFIYHQFFLLCLSFLLGIFIAFFYDIFRAFRKTIHHSIKLIAIEDLLFWIFCAFFIFFLLYYYNNGNIRSYVIFGIILGILFYIFICTPYSTAILLRFFQFFSIIIKRILFFLYLPTKFFLKVLLNPLKKVYRTITIILKTK